MSHFDQKPFLECITAICAEDPELASSMVPTSICRFWDVSLGEPDWLVEGTGLTRSEPLPGWLPLRDDLRIMANLLHHAGETRLLELMLGWSRFPSEQMILAAPDLETAFELVTQSLGADNPQISACAVRERGSFIINFDLHPAFGPFRSIYEQVIIAYYLFIFRSFASIAPSYDSDIAKVTVSQTYSSHDLLARHFDCKYVRDARGPAIRMPDRLSKTSNPEFNLLDWQRLSGRRLKRNGRLEFGKGSTQQEIEQTVRNFVVEHQKAPQVSQIAKLHGFSERTVNRVLAGSGTSFREILEGVRISIAQDLLRNTDLNVQDIAAQLGYSDSSAFVRSFSKWFDVSPAKWRQVEKQQTGKTALSQ